MRHTTFRFTLDPTPEQVALLARHAGASRFAYNQCLRFVTDALASRKSDPSVVVPWSSFDLINAFNTWKRSGALKMGSSPSGPLGLRGDAKSPRRYSKRLLLILVMP
jgi:transposase